MSYVNGLKVSQHQRPGLTDLLGPAGLARSDFHNRELHPTTETWMEQDPAGYVDGENLYEFVRSDPTELVDPFGLAAITYGPPSEPVYNTVQVDYGAVFSFYDKGFIDNYITNASWGRTYFENGSIHTFLRQLSLPPCANSEDRSKLQSAVVAFNDAALQHEEEVERGFLSYLAAGASGDAANKAAAKDWGAYSTAEIKALTALYSSLQQAFASCKCPNNKDNNKIAEALQNRIKNLKDSVVFGPPIPRGYKP